MTEETEKVAEAPAYDVSKEAVRRWFLELGEGFEQSCRLMRGTSRKHFHVYEVRIREKGGPSQGVLLMLKAFGESGAVIAFHQDNSLLQAFINVGKRIANGALEFEVDQYPPKDYEARAKQFRETLSYLESKQPPA